MAVLEATILVDVDTDVRIPLFWGAGDALVDWTGCEFLLQARSSARAAAVLLECSSANGRVWTEAYGGAPNRLVVIAIPRAATAPLNLGPTTPRYWLRYRAAGGQWLRLMEGTLQLSHEGARA